MIKSVEERSVGLKVQRIQDQIADMIRERIIVGEYDRGQRLKQMEVAKEFGVSATPVREAFGILEAEGYLLGSSHKGAMVPKLDKTQVVEIRDLRLLLERELTRHALAHLDDATLAAARDVHERCAEAIASGDRIGVRRLNYRFHFNFYQIAKRPQTLEFVRVLWAKYPFHDLDAIEQRQSRMQQEHENFLTCVESGDREAALEAMQQHITKGWHEVFDD
ncbi:GntR family transcriptional regulator [Acuticoccus sp. M5D2P5]|uniref:GntR family transcriptional regulator n=1 Tax=Acuticoccus kalidii TaxID=2910977 RepID=UPI001F26FE6A|nr:GntR family transcriptional regulator [Acuticoccus kalidii]MCF3933726.1 GntR family transcriptional regulator [Acuticoccus kalidii]